MAKSTLLMYIFSFSTFLHLWLFAAVLIPCLGDCLLHISPFIISLLCPLVCISCFTFPSFTCSNFLLSFPSRPSSLLYYCLFLPSSFSFTTLPISPPPPCSVRDKFVEVDLKPVCKHCYERLPDDMKRRLAKRERDVKDKKKKSLIPMCLWSALFPFSSLPLFFLWSVSIFIFCFCSFVVTFSSFFKHAPWQHFITHIPVIRSRGQIMKANIQ